MNGLDLMIDIETLSSALDARIMTIGLQVFDITTGQFGEAHHLVLPWQKQRRRIDGDTLLWWAEQELFLSTLKMEPNVENHKHAVKIVKQVASSCERVWANDPTFDLAILRNAGFDLGSYRKELSCRTMFCLARDFGIETPPREGDAHDALADAEHQARGVSTIYRALAKRMKS